MASPDEEIMKMPLSIVEASVGFGLDIGGSMAKIIYRSNKEYKNGLPLDLTEKETGMGKVHAVQFPRDDVDTYVKFLRDNCDIKHGGTLYGTGSGGSQYKTKLESLGVKYQSQTEFECFARSLNTLLNQFPKEEWLVELNEEGFKLGLKHLKVMEVMQAMTAGRPPLGKEEFERVYVTQVDNYVKRCKKERKHLGGAPYPYLMVMCGSAFGFIKVSEDGTCELLDLTMISGRFFLGLATVLSGGERDYMKFIEMAKTHDGSTADMLGRDFKSEGQANDTYAMIDADARVFPFGKVHDLPLDQVKPGDMVSSLLQTICENVAMAAFNIAKLHGCRHAYFCGGFVSQEIARRYITMGMCWRCLSVPSGQRVHCDFVQNSGHLGSVGAFLAAAKFQEED